MAKRRTSAVRLSKELDKNRTLVVKESQDWIVATIYHKDGGTVSIPLDVFRAGDMQAAQKISRSRRVIAYGAADSALAEAFKVREEFCKKLDE